jgi:hypothetical protein
MAVQKTKSNASKASLALSPTSTYRNRHLTPCTVFHVTLNTITCSCRCDVRQLRNNDPHPAPRTIRQYHPSLQHHAPRPTPTTCTGSTVALPVDLHVFFESKDWLQVQVLDKRPLCNKSLRIPINYKNRIIGR